MIALVLLMVLVLAGLMIKRRADTNGDELGLQVGKAALAIDEEAAAAKRAMNDAAGQSWRNLVD